LANRSADFNYKVALAEGLKKLQAGRLRQAEEQFRYLVKNFPGAEGGYRGLAKVLVEQEDRAGALRMLVDGGAGLAKAGSRDQAIALYREAVSLDPKDLGAHRRLAAALMLAGSQDDAAHEFVRFINASDEARAKSEAAFALEKLPGNREVADAARRLDVDVPDLPDLPVTTADERAALMKSTFGMDMPAPPPAPMTSAPPPMPAGRWDGPIPEKPAEPAPPADPWGKPPPPLPQRAEAIIARPAGSDDPWAAGDASAEPAPLEDIPADADASSVEASAVRHLANGDPRGGEHALEAARRYIAEGHVDAASDLLLQMVATGVAGHDAQRLLVDVTKSLGKKDVARAKVKLLIEMLRLDGRTELAAEVEQLAETT
jgi:tetratricopeptide (TPR) repeat protein